MSNKFYLLCLHYCLGDHPLVIHKLLERFGSAQDVFLFAQSIDLAEAGLEHRMQLLINDDMRKRVERDVSWLEEPCHHLISYDDEDYPALLKQTYDPPFILFANGNRLALKSANLPVAMVGARSASRHGLVQAETIARDLSNAGVTIVSGLALGIDGAGHRGALSGQTPTIAILGTGCDLVYPVRHQALAERIRETGLLMSEFSLGSPAYPANFPRRNRLVTGMSLATLVIEAAIKSGSLISARLALAQGRDVMAMPGLVTNRLAAGCHLLLRDGATLIQGAADVLEELGIDQKNTRVTQTSLSEVQRGLLNILMVEPHGPDMLAALVNLPVTQVIVALTELEVTGLIYSDMGKYSVS